MKKTIKSLKKLQLSKSIIADLTAREMKFVLGGDSTVFVSATITTTFSESGTNNTDASNMNVNCGTLTHR